MSARLRTTRARPGAELNHAVAARTARRDGAEHGPSSGQGCGYEGQLTIVQLMGSTERLSNHRFTLPKGSEPRNGRSAPAAR